MTFEKDKPVNISGTTVEYPSEKEVIITDDNVNSNYSLIPMEIPDNVLIPTILKRKYKENRHVFYRQPVVDDFMKMLLNLDDEGIDLFYEKNGKDYVLFILQEVLKYYCYGIRNWLRDTNIKRNFKSKLFSDTLIEIMKGIKIGFEKRLNFLSIAQTMHNIPECIFKYDNLESWHKSEVILSLYDIASHEACYVFLSSTLRDKIIHLFDCYRS